METIEEGEIIEVHGQRIEMVKKICEGGCGRKFKVSKNCEDRFYFADCLERCGEQKLTLQQHKKRFNPMHGRPKRITPTKTIDEDYNNDWKDIWSQWETNNNYKSADDGY